MNAHAQIQADDALEADDAEFSAYLAHFMAGALRPDPPWTVSQWADKNRVLASVTSAEPGRWRTSRTPYLQEIMDNMSAYSPVEKQSVMKGVQIGMSEAGFNLVGYTIHHSPGPMMYVMPSLDMMKKFSKTRIDPMIEASPALSSRIAPSRSKDSGNTIFSKDFDGGVLVMTGANSGSGLRGLPIRTLVLDEVDGYPASAGEDGDPVTLAIDRTSTFKRRKIFLLSTPVLKESSRIGAAFREGDQRFYNVACERCGTRQVITWKSIQWLRGEAGEHLPETAAFVCQAHDPETGELCEHRHGEHRKGALLAAGRWVPTAVASEPNVRSYHLSALYSPWYTWEKCVRRFLAIKGDPARMQPFTNNVLGEEWEDLGGERVDPESLMGKREAYKGAVSRVALLTCGVDVQPDRLELETVGWGRDEESWSVDVQVFVGDPSGLEVWLQLDDYLSRRWAHPGFEHGMPITATAIDTGGANTVDAYRFVGPREGRRVWGIKGKGGKYPVWPKKPSRNNKGKINLYSIGVDSAKEVISRRLAKAGPVPQGVSPAGACHFSEDLWDQDAFEQLTVERKRVRYVKGHAVVEWWKPDHARNERLDCRVYSYAALQGLILQGFNLNAEARRVAALVEARRLAAEEPEPATVDDAREPEPEAAPQAASPVEPPRATTKRAKPRRRPRVIASPYM